VYLIDQDGRPAAGDAIRRSCRFPVAVPRMTAERHRGPEA
jgi:hypothetical protein